MRILPISTYSAQSNLQRIKQRSAKSLSHTNSSVETTTNPAYFNINFRSKAPNQKFKLFFSEEELIKRTSSEKLTQYRMLDVDSQEYLKLSEKDKLVLKHLVRASNAFENVYKKLDNPHNLEFEEYLNQEIEKGNKKAEMTKKLYDAQRGIFAHDISGKNIALVKDFENKPNKGLYPEDLSIEEFHNILKKMLLNNEDEEVKKILSLRTIVVRDGEKLKAIPYTEAFKEEFYLASQELYKAAEITEDSDFKEYLILQAQALEQEDPWLDCKADKKWASLQDTTLEFTISRECYDDKMTPSVASNKELKDLLDTRGIVAQAKDNIGVRVGIVDKKGTEYLLKIKDFLPFLASKMPYNNRYTQSISKDSKDTMVDIDIVHVAGDFASYRGGISLATNLPNNDKLAIQTGGHHRTVYHKQMREAKYSDGIKEKLNALLNNNFHRYFSTQALHDFTILHENIHSLGPKEGLESLGVYKNIIEENKADMGSIVMLEELKKLGFYTEEQQKEILTSWIVAYIYPGANFANAHATRNIMQHNYLIKNGAITFDEKNRMKINFFRVTECAREMLNKIIRIQLSREPQKAEEYISSNAIFSKELEILANNLKKVSMRLNSYVEQPLAQKLLK